MLLKPNTDIRAQIVIHGKAVADLDAGAYHDYKRTALAAVLESWQRLTAEFDFVIVEGAGSPAEVNLRDRDIANMGFAEAADIPVILIGDIDRGGLLAHLSGTLDLLSHSERRRTKGLVINRFRGDRSLLQPGLDWLEQHTDKPVLGVLPYLQGLFLDAEDALDRHAEPAGTSGFTVIAPAFPRISNHNDLDPLRLAPEVDFRWIGPNQLPPPADLVVLPGSKSVAADLDWLRRQNGGAWETYLRRHLRYGGKLIGLCGGYQMLGRALHDPHGIERGAGQASTGAGLGLLDCETTLEPEKQLRTVSGHLALPGSAAMTGYEIHMGHTRGPALSRPAVLLADGRREGAISADGQIFATYCHGVFEHPAAFAALLDWAGAKHFTPVDLAARREADIDRLANTVETALDWRLLGHWIT